MSNIKRESRLPKQGTWLGRIVNVCVDYNTEHVIKGLIVREDEEHPGIMIIKLDQLINDNKIIRNKAALHKLKG